ncbi:pre-mycofactocin synthase MftD [Geodermatophilus sabuli]|uniref:pre-mycofactocin synthase MftD n=1 Tax=Geodermatophilus sabuli TaxID=1564158 RepID=UPI00180250F1|nr:pre-mycofactocin synthase MftD [Geodermatophilus sabuli]MBB3082416.1 heme/flavin dehydrogenase (mycofactocin system) [Geodermatophilus sabuli]
MDRDEALACTPATARGAGGNEDEESAEMANAWFESVAEAQRRAKRRLPKGVYGALVAGSDRGLTVDDNTAAFGELGFAPHVAGLSNDRQLATTIMGQPTSMPVMISPTGVQAVHPDGEVAVARAAAARGVPMGLSSFASKPIEDVVEANPQTFFQMYWVGDRDAMAARMERARRAGAVGLIATLDWSFAYGRDWGSPFIPEKIDVEAARRYAPQVLAKPRWLLDFARTGKIPDLTVPNMVATPGEPAPTFFGAYGMWTASPMPSWDDVTWLREQWGGQFMLKGVMRVDDAKRAVDAGVTAISVSNHGGNNLDGTPAAIRALPAIAEAVGDQVEVLMDGGIRRGSDVAKALALGARAVMIGRAYLWGLAANGQAGVENVLDLLRDGLGSALIGLGHTSIADLGPGDLVIPPFFERHLGTPGADAPAGARASGKGDGA